MGKTVKAKDFDFNPPVVYEPEFKVNQLVRFKKFVEKKYKIDIKSYWELQEWSCKNFPEFWDCLWRFFDIKYSQPYTQVFDRKNSFDNAQWFKGVRFNYAENILKYRDSHTALIATDDDDDTRYVTYKELYDEVRVYVKALKDIGIQKGDVVASYMSNKIEAVFIFLAIASIGATWNGSLPIMGVKGTLTRLQEIKPKVLFTAGNFNFQTTENRMDQKVPEIVSALPSLQKVVFVPSKSLEKKEDITGIPKCVYISDLLERARKALQSDSSELVFEQLPFEHPLCITYTSGTTGNPKGLIHSAGSFLGSLKDYGLHQDCDRNDVLFNFCPGGWVLWNLFINCLHLGLTVILYEGEPFEDSPNRFWDLVDKFGITSACIASSTLDAIAKKGYAPNPNHSLKTLRMLIPMGSPVKPQNFKYISEKIKPGLFFSPLYGCSEMFSSISGVDSNYPIHLGEMQLLSLGLDIRILDEEDRPVLGEKGELVLANPYPPCTMGLVNDNNKDKLREIYLTKHPGYWNVADSALLNPVTKGLIVYGRNDESMSPHAARFNAEEIYNVLEDLPGLLDYVCVSQFNSNREERAVLFVMMKPGYSFTPAVGQEIQKTIEYNLTYEYLPEVIMETADIPYNLTGKKLHSLVKKLINKESVMNEDIVRNASSVEFYKTVDLGPY